MDTEKGEKNWEVPWGKDVVLGTIVSINNNHHV